MRLKPILYLSLLLIGGRLFAQADFTSNVTEGCVPLEVFFAIDTASYDISSITVAEWDFGNDSIVTTNNPADTVSTTYLDPKRYSVKLTINNDPDNSITRSGYVNAVAPLDSDFNMKEDPDALDYTFGFTPTIETLKADATYHFVWEYWDADVQLDRVVKIVDASNPENAADQYTFADTGAYDISLTVRELNPDYTCEAKTQKELLIVEEFVIPNAYSPESVAYFIVDPENPSIVLSFQLFSRTGMKVFEQEAPVVYWDGRTSAGQDLGEGVYFYVVKATSASDDPEGYYTKNGFIHLFR